MASTNKLLIGTILILALALLAGILPIHGEEEIYDTVVRLHVLANSDSETDQALKLTVRDRILETVTPAVEDCRTQAEAIAAIGAVMDELEEVAEEAVRDAGYDYAVSVQIGEEEYPTRVYESCAFPAGEYVSLRVLIGEAEGANWWCCLFPPLCLSAATEQSSGNEDAFIAVGLNSDQYKIITETENTKYYLRFKILEVIKGK